MATASFSLVAPDEADIGSVFQQGDQRPLVGVGDDNHVLDAGLPQGLQHRLGWDRFGDGHDRSPSPE